jgi:hypothetical protein
MQPDRSSVSFAILGRPFAARNLSSHLAEWLRASWDYPDLVAPAHPYTIELEAVAWSPTGARDQWIVKEVSIPGRTLGFRNAGRMWETGDAGAGLRLELRDGASRIELWGCDGGGDLAALYHGLYVSLSEALRASGLVPIHAAVAAQGDETVAWLGASGIGKSTTLLHAVEAGWRAIAEDLCWLEPGTLRVYGWDRGVRCWPETLDRFLPQLREAQSMADGKRLIPYDRLGADQPRTGILTRWAVLGRDAGGASRWEPATAREVVKSLWEATGVPLSEQSRDATASVVARLSRLPVARLVLGNTPPPLAGAAGAETDQDRGG